MVQLISLGLIKLVVNIAVSPWCISYSTSRLESQPDSADNRLHAERLAFAEGPVALLIPFDKTKNSR